MFDRGYWQVGKLRGVPVRLHWTLPLGAIVFSGGAFVPAFWLAFILLILIHEFGHAGLVRRFGHRTIAVDVTGFGGLCRWSGHATEFERSAIAWGGVLAQGVILLGTLAFVVILGTPQNPHASQVVHAFTRANLLLIGLNLLPFPPLDGAEAWKILRQGRLQHLMARARDRLSRQRRPSRFKTRKQPPGEVIDFERFAKRKRGAKSERGTQDDVAHPTSGKPETKDPEAAKHVANELIRIAEESARARKKHTEN